MILGATLGPVQGLVFAHAPAAADRVMSVFAVDTPGSTAWSRSKIRQAGDADTASPSLRARSAWRDLESPSRTRASARSTIDVSAARRDIEVPGDGVPDRGNSGRAAEARTAAASSSMLDNRAPAVAAAAPDTMHRHGFVHQRRQAVEHHASPTAARSLLDFGVVTKPASIDRTRACRGRSNTRRSTVRWSARWRICRPSRLKATARFAGEYLRTRAGALRNDLRSAPSKDEARSAWSRRSSPPSPGRCRFGRHASRTLSSTSSVAAWRKAGRSLAERRRRSARARLDPPDAARHNFAAGTREAAARRGRDVGARGVRNQARRRCAGRPRCATRPPTRTPGRELPRDAPPEGNSDASFFARSGAVSRRTPSRLPSSSAEGRGPLWLRPLAATPGTRDRWHRRRDGAFWSPDSQQILFFVKGVLRQSASPAAGPRIVNKVRTGVSPAGTGNRDGVLVVGAITPDCSACRSRGGAAVPLTTVDASAGESSVTRFRSSSRTVGTSCSSCGAPAAIAPASTSRR